MDNDETQNNGVKWIGAIPQGWKWYRIKDVAELSPTYSADKPDLEMLCTVIPMECVSEKGIIDTSNIDKYGNVSKGLTFFEKGDVIFAKITPCMENGKGAYIENLPTKYAFGSTEFHVLRTSYKLDGKFLYYYTFNDGFRDFAAVNMTGAAGQKRVSTNFLKYTPIYLPGILEQQAIAQYLDQRCGKLDAIIAIKQQQIKTLDALRQSIIYHAVTKGLDDSVPLVDSGVEWLGKIPQRWKVSKLRYEISIKNGDFISNKLDDESKYPVVGGNGFMGRTDDFNVKGDIIVIGRVGAYCGNVHYINEKSWVSDNALIVDTGNNKRFFTYLLNAFNLNSIANKTAQPVVTATNIKAIYIPKPPLPEQQSIVDYLDQETQRLNDLKENLTLQISTLEAYKKALIYECVTGKKRIKAEDLKAG